MKYKIPLSERQQLARDLYQELLSKKTAGLWKKIQELPIDFSDRETVDKYIDSCKATLKRIEYRSSPEGAAEFKAKQLANMAAGTFKRPSISHNNLQDVIGRIAQLRDEMIAKMATDKRIVFKAIPVPATITTLEQGITTIINATASLSKYRNGYDACMVVTKKKTALGRVTGNRFWKRLIKRARGNSIKKGFNAPTITTDIISTKYGNGVYISPIGIELPMIDTIGWLHSATMDRRDDSIGYHSDNVDIRPLCFNTAISLKTTKNWVDWYRNMMLPFTRMELDDIVLLINGEWLCRMCSNNNVMTKFYSMSTNSKKNSEDRGDRCEFEFQSNEECRDYLVRLFILQGCRSKYSNTRLLLSDDIGDKIKSHPLMPSFERIDARKGYTRMNTCLIEVALQCGVNGQTFSKYITPEEREIAYRATTGLPEYINKVLKRTPQQLIEIARENNKVANYIIVNLLPEKRDLLGFKHTPPYFPSI